MATNSTNASWENVNTGVISDVSISSVVDKNILRYDNTSSKWKNTADLTTAENTIYNLTYSTGIFKNINSVTNGAANVTSYINGTDSNLLLANNTTADAYILLLEIQI